MSNTAYIPKELMFISIKEMLNSIATPKPKPKSLALSMQATIKYISTSQNGIEVWLPDSVKIRRQTV